MWSWDGLHASLAHIPHPTATAQTFTHAPPAVPHMQLTTHHSLTSIPHPTLSLTLPRCLLRPQQETQLALEKAIKAVSDPSTPATAAATMAPIARASLTSSLSSMDGADSVKGAAADAQVGHVKYSPINSQVLVLSKGVKFSG